MNSSVNNTPVKGYGFLREPELDWTISFMT